MFKSKCWASFFFRNHETSFSGFALHSDGRVKRWMGRYSFQELIFKQLYRVTYKEWQKRRLDHFLVAAPELRKHHPAVPMDEVSFEFRRVQTIQPTHPTVLHLVFQNLKFHIIPNPLMQKTAISKHHQQNHQNFLKKNDLKKCASNVGIDCGSNFLPNVSNDSRKPIYLQFLNLTTSFQGTHRRGRSSENFLMFCKMILDYENYEETLREDQLRRWDTTVIICKNRNDWKQIYGQF